MKKLLLASFIILLVLSLTTPAYCDDILKKLGRGVCNVLTCPLEVLEQIKRVNSSDGPFGAVTYGPIKGVWMTAVRAVVGVYEIATFPIPFPKDYKPILTDPEFFFEQANW